MTNVPQNNLPVDLLVDSSTKNAPSLIQRWYAYTSLPDIPADSTFVQREAVRRSRLSSSVIFFFILLVFSLLPVTYLVIGIYPSYFWLTAGLFVVCLIGLFFNRRGLTNTAGFIVTIGAFITLTCALFSTVPFDETTLQGYDMLIVLLLLSVSLLPIQAIFLFFVLSVGVIIGTLLTMPLTPALQADLNSRLLIVLARPIGTLFMGGGVAYILATHLTRAISRANRAETVAKLEHEQAKLRKDLEKGIDQILQTHVQVSNGNFNARAPLSDDSVLWQIARSLNNLLVRFQRAIHAEQHLQNVDQDITNLVVHVQSSKKEKRVISLPLTKNPHLDPLITELQGETISMARPPSIPGAPATPGGNSYPHGNR